MRSCLLVRELQLRGERSFIAPQNVTAPDLSGTEQGEGTEASNRLLKDYPQIKSRGSAQQIYASGLGYFLKKSGAGRPGKGDFGDPDGGDMEHPDHGGVVASHRGVRTWERCCSRPWW